MIKNVNKVKHQPVLLHEILDLLAVKPGEKFIDATVGSGGHAAGIVRRGGQLLGIDRDAEALKRSEVVLRAACPTPHLQEGEGLPYRLVKSNFVFLEKVARENDFSPVAGIVFDLGFSTEQVEDPERGFSFSEDGPLDMRMDKDDPVTAADLINGLNERRLYELFTQLAEEPRARAIARVVVSARGVKPITTTKQLKDLSCM
jgi:16S rRNA (cytosine1402-N4)-methyltransferase